jgi:uncharacterized protein (DUF4415 family)
MERDRIDPDSPPMTDAFLEGFKPVREVAPELVVLEESVKAKRGRPPAEETKEAIKLRLSPRVLRHFRDGGPGWQTRINETLELAVFGTQAEAIAQAKRLAKKRAAKKAAATAALEMSTKRRLAKRGIKRPVQKRARIGK